MNELNIACQCLPILYKRVVESYEEEHRFEYTNRFIAPGSAAMEAAKKYRIYMDRDIKETMRLINTIRVANGMTEISIGKIFVKKNYIFELKGLPK